MWIAKYSAQGALQWGKSIWASGAQAYASSVVADSQNNIVVAGYYNGTIDFGGVSLKAFNPNSMYVAKYSPTGGLLWAKSFGGTGMASDFGSAVAVDGSDNVIFLGRLQSASVNFGGSFNLSPLGSSSLALVKLSSSGTTLWAKAYGTGTLLPAGVAIDRFGDIAVTGRAMGGSVDFGGGSISCGGAYNTFVGKYSGADGGYRWAKSFGGSNADGGYGIACDPTTGNIVVTGGFSGTADFGGGAVTSTAEAVYLAGYDTSGNFLWVRTYGGAAGNSQGNSVKIDANGNLAMTGAKAGAWNVGGTINFNGGVFVHVYAISGNAAPTLTWSKLPGANTGSSQGNGIAFDGQGHVLVTGWFASGTVDFGGMSATTAGNTQYGFVTEYTK